MWPYSGGEYLDKRRGAVYMCEISGGVVIVDYLPGSKESVGGSDGYSDSR